MKEYIMELLDLNIHELLKKLEEHIVKLDETTLAKVKEELKELEAKIDNVLKKA